MTMRFLLRTCALTASATALLAGGFACSDNPRPITDGPLPTIDAPPPPPASALTDAQFARLQAAFPAGVCDFSKPGVGQTAAVSPLDFSNGPGGLPLATLTPATGFRIKTLSNRPDLISGGDALTEIVLPAGGVLSTVTVNGQDATTSFATVNGRILGKLNGMADGINTVAATLVDGTVTTLTINNHKIGGPVISGAQVTPFVCATVAPHPASPTTAATNASGMSTEAIDAQCNIATEVKLWYHSKAAGCTNVLPDPVGGTPPNSCFKRYDVANPPAATDLDTATVNGTAVPYIVRTEMGTVNRGIFVIAVLFDPTASDAQLTWDPLAAHPTWNGKVIYTFGASSGQPRRQFRSEQSWTDNNALSRGFMVALNSQTDSLYNSNRVTMSETALMMKEKVVDTYGEIKSLIGNGCSGGSINQLTTASIMPGLFDGIQPTCTYSDSETTGLEVADCAQLVHFYNSPEWKALVGGLTQDQINAKKAAINGHIDQTGCHAWVNSFAGLGQPGNYIPNVVLDNVTGATGPNPTVTTPINNCQLPASMVYDPTTNPNGVRCTGADHGIAIFGRVPGTNRARTTLDNVGVQYGLKAFLAGTISGEDFVTLNEKIGGQSRDAQFVDTRSAADEDGLKTAYLAGIVSDGAHLAKTPIIDLRGFDDTNLAPIAPPGAFGIHHVWRSFALRARLDAATGNHNNHAMWRYGTGLVAPGASGLTLQSFLMMDQWVDAIKADTTAATIEQKIASHKPTAAADFCFMTTDTTFTNRITDFSTCDTDVHLKPHASPRQIAGGPLAENVLKCQLRPITRADYGTAK